MGKHSDRFQDERFSLEMTSMIDVVFLLLIFFMCATKFKIPEGTLDSFLPRDRGTSAGSAVVTLGARVTLWIDEGTGVLHCDFDERPVAMDNTQGEFESFRGIAGPNLEQLEMFLRERKLNYVGTGSKGLPVVIDFMPKVPFKYVVDVMNLCVKVGIEDVAFASPGEAIE